MNTKTNTPAASQTATPRSEPIPTERLLTPFDATSIFFKSLLQSAEDFLGKKVDGAVISIPGWFGETQQNAALAADSVAAADDLSDHADRLTELVAFFRNGTGRERRATPANVPLAEWERALGR